MSHYGIHIPRHDEADEPKIFVFSDKLEAFAMLKNHKEARLKEFRSAEEALNFSKNGAEVFVANNSETQASLLLLNVTIKSPFRAPKSQDLVLFRKSIEHGKYDVVQETIWNNPRYLIGAGDTPTILKESFRYNALHSSVLSKNAKMCQIILKAIGDPTFIEMIHGKQNSQICQDVSNILLDLYLNMPEKGRNETPLHLAVKFGVVDVIEILTSYPQCKATPNMEGKYPKDLICFRLDNPSAELCNRIADLLEERFYVPVIRSVDNSMPPIIGEPFSPTNPPNLVFDPLSPEMEIQAYAGPMNKEQAHVFRRRWKTPPRITTPNCSSQSVSLNGSGSPYPHHISPIKMRKFTPNKSLQPPQLCSTPKSAEKRAGARQLLFSPLTEQTNLENNNHQPDQNKESENVFAENSDNNQNVLLPAMCDNIDEVPVISKGKDLFSTYRDKRLKKLSEDLNDSSFCLNSSVNSAADDSFAYHERHLKLTDAEKGLEVIGRELAKSQNVEWKEYWNFLDGFVDIRTEEGLNKLEKYINQRKEKKIMANKRNVRGSLGNPINHTPMSTLSDAFNKINMKDTEKSQTFGKPLLSELSVLLKSNLKSTASEAPAPPMSPNATSAYLCLEKSCQVYAKRMTKTIIQNLKNIVSINDSLKAELKLLKSLISSYQNDTRFIAVNFQFTHSRFAHLIVSYLYQEVDIDFVLIRSCLERITQSTVRILTETNILRNESITANNLQLLCLINFLIKYIDEKDTIISPASLTTEKDCADIWVAQQKCHCVWHMENSRKERQKKRNSKRFELNKNFDNYRCDVDSDDDYVSVSSSDDEDEVFYTPPESLSDVELENDESVDNVKNYSNYLLGDEPTKTDVDVLNALNNVEIDKNTYPNIFQWKAAVLQHSVEERNNFPSPSVISNGPHTPKNDAITSAKRLFGTPTKIPKSPVKKNVKFSNFLKPSSLELSSDKDS